MIILGLLLFCITKPVFSAPMEPVCSKFAYEEQLLEKMVRMEFFVENMQKDMLSSVTDNMATMKGITDRQTDISNNLTGFSEMLEDFEKQFEEFQANVSDTVKRNIKGITKEIEDFGKKFEDFKTSITETMEQKVKTMEEMKNSKIPLVAFNVYGAMDHSGGSNMIFKNIRLNEGEAYSKDTGVFTAPVDGLYQFNAHICIKKQVDVDYHLKVDDTWIVKGEYRIPADSGDGKCTSFGAVASVRKGETVRVGGMSFDKVFINSDDWNSFSGVLILAI
ncbi:heavy metal-binding protein HIP-like [Mercenaria mercenaria]|uniref:heavy metal-binding protein HIP-like n=1 Tax=Mercenaria mercenaria TaxID=6596 RepID=UPI00234E636E|nr:heavy metal-binding protein HIP-like [Mercenaria mercenaria]